MFRLALCQVNPVVGDVDANAELVLERARAAADAGADLAVFPEQVIAGYPAEDLLHKAHFLDRCDEALAHVVEHLPIPALVGTPLRDGQDPGRVHNAAVLAQGGTVTHVHRKLHLPNYAVFDEHRWFTAGDTPLVLDLQPTPDGGAVRIGVTVCEDIWIPDGPHVAEAADGARVVVNLSASPWRIDRHLDRERMVASRARECGCWVALCNLVGGQDELVFDGRSLVAAPDGTVTARGAAFAEDMVVVDVDPDASSGVPALPETAGEPEQVWAALRLGLGDYVRKNGFERVVLGLSGGIDSALVLALAVDELGAGCVHAATMPSRYSSEGTRSDAWEMARRLDVELVELPIEPAFEAFEATLATVFAGREPDVTEENLQARIRGTMLMALSNKFGHLVLATGNKSEYAVGYATLYGDMNGGFAPLKDVPKTLVFRLARWRNELAASRGQVEPIPSAIVERPPSAELRADQRDSDSLPDYDTLDRILELLVVRDHGVEDAIADGLEPELVQQVQRMLDRAEYKRRQAPPGVRVTSKAFGRDRRVPITHRFDGRIPARSGAAGTGAPRR